MVLKWKRVAAERGGGPCVVYVSAQEEDVQTIIAWG
jgi:hypothetical protein